MRPFAGALTLLASGLPAWGQTAYELTPETRSWSENRYASDLFNPIWPAFEVIASRRYHGKFGGWGCTYVIVALVGSPPASPPSSGTEGYAWDMGFGEDGWQPSPAPALGDTTRDAIASCEQEWPDGLGDRLRDVLDRPGSFFIRDLIGEDVEIWSAPARLAARLRYGD